MLLSFFSQFETQIPVIRHFGFHPRHSRGTRDRFPHAASNEKRFHPGSRPGKFHLYLPERRHLHSRQNLMPVNYHFRCFHLRGDKGMSLPDRLYQIRGSFGRCDYIRAGKSGDSSRFQSVKIASANHGDSLSLPQFLVPPVQAFQIRLCADSPVPNLHQIIGQIEAEFPAAERAEGMVQADQCPSFLCNLQDLPHFFPGVGDDVSKRMPYPEHPRMPSVMGPFRAGKHGERIGRIGSLILRLIIMIRQKKIIQAHPACDLRQLLRREHTIGTACVRMGISLKNTKFLLFKYDVVLNGAAFFCHVVSPQQDLPLPGSGRSGGKPGRSDCFGNRQLVPIAASPTDHLPLRTAKPDIDDILVLPVGVTDPNPLHPLRNLKRHPQVKSFLLGCHKSFYNLRLHSALRYLVSPLPGSTVSFPLFLPLLPALLLFSSIPSPPPC